MNGIVINRFSKISTDGTGSCLFWIGCAHDFTIFENCIFTFKHLHKDRSRAYEGNECFEERTFFMDGIKSVSLCFAQTEHFRTRNAPAFLFKSANDVADVVFRNSIWLDDRECAFNWHGVEKKG